MTTELQNKAWSILPKEFKEEVKKEYAKYLAIDVDDNPNLPAYAVESATSRMALLKMLFGEHNLTSDAEGEEMLTVSRNEVQKIYKQADSLETCNALDALFGSKCLPDELNEDNFAKSESQYHIGDKVEVIGYDYGLPSLGRCIGKVFTVSDVKYDANRWMYKLETDEWLFDERDYLKSILWCEHFLKPYEEPKPAEPKLKVGDKVQVNKKGDPWRGAIGEIIDISDNGSCYVLFPHGQAWFRNVDLEPYTEPTDHIGKNSEKVDRIIKDGFRDHNRLHIAALAITGLLANPSTDKEYKTYQTCAQFDKDIVTKEIYVASKALRYADALIAECEKGGSK